MGTYPVLIAVTGAWEAPLVSAVEAAPGEVVVARRCADLTDLLAAASGGRARAALVSADLRRFDRDSVARLRQSGVAVVGVATPGLSEHFEHLMAIGVADVLAADAEPSEIERVVVQAVGGPGGPRVLGGPDGAGADGGWPSGRAGTSTAPGSVAAPADPALAVETARWSPSASLSAGDDLVELDEPTQPEDLRGRLVVVWGPVGSPGRTTVAVTLAAELAALGDSTLLADADTYGASVGQSLGVLDEAPGLAAACRAATSGSLDPVMLARLAPVVSRDLRVLTGITRADRWPEMSVAALEQVWSVARAVAAWTVIDTGFSLERDEELSYDTMAPRRNGATLSALEAADAVLAVGSADPVGLQRLVRGLGELAEVLPDATPKVVVTRSRASAVGTAPDRRVREALQRYAGVGSVTVVPDDRPALDAAMLAGRTLTEHQPFSPARMALNQLALDVSGRLTARPRRGRRTARTAPAQ